jgi:hypothetical protein
MIDLCNEIAHELWIILYDFSIYNTNCILLGDDADSFTLSDASNSIHSDWLSISYP